MKMSKVLLNISAFVCFIYGALYTFSLVFIPIGIYCFIAGKRFSHKAEHIDDLYAIDNKVFKNYVIFTSIACFPLGLLVIIPYLKLTGNNVRVNHVESTEDIKVETVDDSQENKKAEVKSVEVQKEETLTETEKLEKFKKLENFKEKGLITDEELEMAREQLFGKKNNSDE